MPRRWGPEPTGPRPLHHPPDGSPPFRGGFNDRQTWTKPTFSKFDSARRHAGPRRSIVIRSRGATRECRRRDHRRHRAVRPRAARSYPPHKVVGITGTNGKSTTTARSFTISSRSPALADLSDGRQYWPANDPRRRIRLRPTKTGLASACSSFRVTSIDLTCRALDCDVAVLLQYQPPDHLDRYDSFEAYAASKARLLDAAVPGSSHSFIVRLRRKIIDEDRRSIERRSSFSNNLIRWPEEAFDQTEWPSLAGSPQRPECCRRDCGVQSNWASATAIDRPWSFAPIPACPTAWSASERRVGVTVHQRQQGELILPQPLPRLPPMIAFCWIRRRSGQDRQSRRMRAVFWPTSLRPTRSAMRQICLNGFFRLISR